MGIWELVIVGGILLVGAVGVAAVAAIIIFAAKSGQQGNVMVGPPAEKNSGKPPKVPVS